MITVISNPWEQIQKSGRFDFGQLLDAAFIKFKVHLKMADSNHLLVDQISQMETNISEFPRPRSPIRLSNDFLDDDINEPAVVLGSSFLQYGTRVSIISAFAALDDFLLAVSICFEAFEKLSNEKPFTIKDLQEARIRGFKRAHKSGASEELIKKLGVEYIDSKALEMIAQLKAMRNCLVHRWGIVANKDLNSEDKAKLIFEYFDHRVDKNFTELLKNQHGDIVNHPQSVKQCSYGLGEEIIFSSMECQKVLITLDILVRGILWGTLEWCKATGKVKESNINTEKQPS